MPMHLKDLENRMHESCGFYHRDPSRVLLPGHIVLTTEDFAAFAEYIITGGGHGWAGSCPYPRAIEQAVGTIKRMNMVALTDRRAPAFIGDDTPASQAKGTHKLLADEQFYMLFKEKFANWKPIASDMARLPEPVRNFIAALQDKAGPEDKTLALLAQTEENKALHKQITEYRQKLLARDKEVSGLSEYVDEVESKLTEAEKKAEAFEERFVLGQKHLGDANAAFKAEQQAHIDVSNELSLKIARIDELEAQMASLTEDLKVAEELLTQSEEARERQNARFRQGRVSDEAAGETTEVEAAPPTEESVEPESE